MIRYFGAGARRWVAYSVASASGTVLAVCFCTVPPLFGGIYRRGAGIGPAMAFPYSGPVINVLAIILTARVLGWQLGVARAAGVVVFSVVIELIVVALYRREEAARASASFNPGPTDNEKRSPAQNLAFFAALVAILVFAAWGRPAEPVGTVDGKAGTRRRSDPGAVGVSSRTGQWPASEPAFMYFATLTEVPILRGLPGSGMGQGPALALLLTGPALSLPNILVIRSVIGTETTVVYVCLVVVVATFSGMAFGLFVG